MPAVRQSKELERVISMPRRVVAPELAVAVASHLTSQFKTIGGTWKLKEIQGTALWELKHFGGLFAPIQVGGGKTLISALAPEAVGAHRTVLLIPAKLKNKTIREFRRLSEEFVFSTPKIITYEALGRENHARDLEAYEPDLIVCDEAHKLKNISASVTRRVARYMHEHPNTRFVAMSGTISKRSILDFAHLLKWTLKANAPIPLVGSEIEEWADALDEKVSGFNGTEPGALIHLCNAEERSKWFQDPRGFARRAFNRRLTETPGVVASAEGTLGTSLQIEASVIESLGFTPGAELERVFHHYRRFWELPDGHSFVDPLEYRRHARELAQGFFQVWDPRPPKRWLLLRRLWHRFIRRSIFFPDPGAPTLDSMKHVEVALIQGHLRPRTVGQMLNENDEKLKDALLPGDLELEVLSAWRETEPSFTPKTKTIWVDDYMLRAAEWWGKQSPAHSLIWVEHVPFGEELSRRTGWRYYHETDAKDPVENADHTKPIIVGVASNAEGKNLQHKWNRNLLLSMPSNGMLAEQLIGRTHRPDIEKWADEVIVDVFFSVVEHIDAFDQCIRDARNQETRSPQKLLYGDVTVNTHGAARSYRWTKVNRTEKEV